ncbi:hypothetical protein BJF92_15275 [Rhizobium rhizosphaerae]|uniref:YcaO domain-containing protein n=1 Tax=Xaviernesmea rhizosphaerae TaxID=1672749 RepID=A0A1Q9AM10_9HYPH|nr:hypothetical protein BJF92_15275 [Xaviernesmea rhizosphaerae]
MDPELLKRFGITRIGDVTDLDIIGVPVWFATRPNSRGLSVAQGKGLTVEQARISAVMEAIEGAVAEDTQSHIVSIDSLEAMRARGVDVIPLETLGRVNVDNLDGHQERAWVRGRSVRHGNDVFAPYELIGLDFRADFPWDRRAFHMSSEGLAAGFDYDRAILHALLELVENDACFLIDAFETRIAASGPITLKRAVNPALDLLMAHISERGLSVDFFNLTTDIGIPVVMASLRRSILTVEGPTVRHSAGVACRLTVHDAALAALLEAIQARLTDISGARDDLSPNRYQMDHEIDAKRPPRDPVENGFPCVTFTSKLAAPMWQPLADHLFAVGVDDIYLFPLTTGVEGLHVVRTLAKGLNATGPGLQRMKPAVLEQFLFRRARP